MKKNYIAPEAGLLCFAPVEALATDIKFGDLINVGTNLGGSQGATATTSDRDIKINV